MGNSSNSTQKKTDETESEEKKQEKTGSKKSFKQISSFGDKLQSFRDEVRDMVEAGDIAPTKQLRKYKLYHWKKQFGDHASIVVVPILSEEEQQVKQPYGSLVINLCVDDDEKIIWLHPQCITREETIDKIANKWEQFIFINEKSLITYGHPMWKRDSEKHVGFLNLQLQISTSGLRLQKNEIRQDETLKKSWIRKTYTRFTFNTYGQNFVDLACELLRYHGKYSLYCNNCQSFVQGYHHLVRNQFIDRDSSYNCSDTTSDGEMIVNVLGQLFWLPGVALTSAINGSLKKSNKNQYHKRINDRKLLDSQKRKMELFKSECLVEDDKIVIDTLWEYFWNLEKAIEGYKTKHPERFGNDQNEYNNQNQQN